MDTLEEESRQDAERLVLRESTRREEVDRNEESETIDGRKVEERHKQA